MLISLGIIAFNEEEYLPDLLNDILKQDFSLKNVELLFIDGNSSDKTKSIMESFKEQNESVFSKIEIFDNPSRWQPAGWNVFLKNATGDVIIKVDAHSHIPSDFVKKEVSLIEQGEYVAGGKRPTILKENSIWSNILLEAENSLFGSGIAIFRTSEKKQYVKSIFHGAYRKEVFEKVGGFNENLRRTEDNEIHYRIREAGYKILYDPSVVSYQYARPTLKKMIKQKYANGFWIGKTTWICQKCLSLYHYIPFVFVLSVFACLGMVKLTMLPLILLGISYSLFNILNTFSSIFRRRKFSMINLIYIIPLLHISYGVGTLFGLLSKNNSFT